MLPQYTMTMLFRNPIQSPADGIHRIEDVFIDDELIAYGFDLSAPITDVTTSASDVTVQRKLTDVPVAIGGILSNMTTPEAIAFLTDALKNVIPQRAPCQLLSVVVELGGPQ